MTEQPTKQTRLTTRRFVRLALWSVVAVVVVTVLAGVGLYLRLLIAPISGEWLKARVEGQLEQIKPDGMILEFDRIEVSLTPTGNVRVRLTDLVVELPNGQVQLDANTANVDIDMAAAMTGRFRVANIDLIEGEVLTYLPYMESGPLRRPIPFGVQFVDTGLQLVRNAVDGRLGTARLAGMKVSFTRNEWPRSVDFQAADVTIGWEHEALVYDGTFVGSERPWTVSVRREVPRDDGERDIRVEIKDVAPRDLAGDPKLAGESEEPTEGVERSGFPIDLTIIGRFRGASELISVRTEADIGQGRIGPQETPISIIDAIELDIDWALGDQQLTIDKLVIEAGRTEVIANGVYRPQWFTTDGRGEFVLRADAPVFSLGGEDDQLVERVTFQAHGIVDLPNRSVSVSRVDFVTDEAAVAVTGSADFSGVYPELTLALSVRDTAFTTALALWPPIVGINARQWFERHIRQGQIESGELAFRLGEGFFDGNPATPAWSDDNMRGQFTLNDMALWIVDSLPVVPGVGGIATIEGGAVRFEGAPMMAHLESGRAVTLPSGTVQIDDARRPNNRTTLAIAMEGEAAGIVEVLAGLLPSVVEQAGVTPGDILGDGRIETTLTYEAGQDPRLGPVSWSSVGRVAGLGSLNPIQGRTLEDGDLSFEINQDRARLSGTALLDGVPAELDIDRSLIELQGGIASGISFTLDAKTRKRIGLDFGDMLTGSVLVTLTNSSPETGQSFEVDLTNATISVPPIGYAKSSGSSARAAFRLIERDGVRRIEDLVFQTDRPVLIGRAALDGDGLSALTLDQLRLSPDDRVSANLQRTASGYAVTLSGEQMDLRRIIDAAKAPRRRAEGAAPDGSLSIDVQGQISRVIGHNGISMGDANFGANVIGRRLMNARVTSILEGGPLTADWVLNGTWRDVRLETRSIGSLFRFAALSDRIVGGETLIEGRLPAPGNSETGQGTIFVSDFVLQDEDSLREVERRIELDGRRGLARRNQRAGNDAENISLVQGVNFNKLTALFQQSGDVLSLREVALQGNVIGAVAQGDINLRDRQIDMRGTIIPLYGLNNLFGRVPVLGQILGGGERGGLLGLTFRYFGPLDSAKTTVNPASLLTPGIFRKVFGLEPLSN